MRIMTERTRMGTQYGAVPWDRQGKHGGLWIQGAVTLYLNHLVCDHVFASFHPLI